MVDAIEKSFFKPVPLERLKEKVKGRKETFAVRVCRNCDDGFFQDYVPEEEQEEFVMGNLLGGGYKDLYLWISQLCRHYST